MKKLAVALALCLFPSLAFAQCSGQFANGQVCGVASGGPKFPAPASIGSFLSSLPLVQNHIFLGNAGNIATDTATGTGVAAALQVNVGSAGAPVLFNGALGTPSSGILSGNITMTFGSDGTGDIYYRNSSGFLTRLGIGSAAQALVVSGGLPSWQNAGSGTVTSATIAGTAGNIAVSGTCTITTSGTCTVDLAAARKTLPTTQVFLSGSATYTTPANVLWIEVELVGGGGGGSGSGTAPGNGGNGGTSTWGSGPILSSGTANGGTGATAGTGGTPTGGYLNLTGGDGGAGSGATTANPGGQGGISCGGGAGAGGTSGAGAGRAAATNSGSGGGGGGVNTTANGGGGGGGGGCVRAIFNTPNATYTYAVGAAGTAGTAGGSGAAGGAGAAGRISVIEHYGS